MKNAKLYALVGILTLGNIGFRVASEERAPTARLVSHLEAGERVESVELARLLDGFETAGGACRMVVAFNPDCPFCQAASQRERRSAREGAWGETLWITDRERPRLAAFVAGLSEASRHAVAPEAFEALDVDAVPALFLVDPRGALRWVGPYRGDETVEVLAERCDRAAPPSGATLATGGVTAVSGS